MTKKTPASNKFIRVETARWQDDRLDVTEDGRSVQDKIERALKEREAAPDQCDAEWRRCWQGDIKKAMVHFVETRQKVFVGAEPFEDFSAAIKELQAFEKMARKLVEGPQTRLAKEAIDRRAGDHLNALAALNSYYLQAIYKLKLPLSGGALALNGEPISGWINHEDRYQQRLRVVFIPEGREGIAGLDEFVLTLARAFYNLGGNLEPPKACRTEYDANGNAIINYWGAFAGFVTDIACLVRLDLFPFAFTPDATAEALLRNRYPHLSKERGPDRARLAREALADPDFCSSLREAGVANADLPGRLYRQVLKCKIKCAQSADWRVHPFHDGELGS